MAKVRWKRLALISVVVAAISVVVIDYFLNFVIYGVRDVSVEEVVCDPQSFDGVHVRLRGYVVDTSVYMFGPKYMLMGDEGDEIALGGKGGPENVDLGLYVSFIFDGENYTRIRSLKVIVVGYVRYVGPATDVPPCHLDVETVKEANTVHTCIIHETKGVGFG